MNDGECVIWMLYTWKQNTYVLAAGNLMDVKGLCRLMHYASVVLDIVHCLRHV
jgi:hypothetical protein